MKKYKLILNLLILFLIFNIYIPVYGNDFFNLSAKSAILIDASTGKIIYEKNSHEKLKPASITKIMVLLLAMEALENNKIKLNDQVVVSENASGMGGSQVYLEAGEQISVESLIRAIAVRSANDASVALAEHIAGSLELFIKMMNDKAKLLGMKDTNFVNCTGLDDEDHYTTAYDVSIMSRELLKHSKIHNWLSIYLTSIMVGKDKDVVQNLVNTNKLIRFYKGANGIKTGYTSKSGYCLAASATRGNLTLISVVLGCRTSNIRFNESRKLLDYGFANFDFIPIYKKGDIIKRIKVTKGKIDVVNVVVNNDLSVLIKKGANNNIEKKVYLPNQIESPIHKFDKVGEVVIFIDGKRITKADLIVDKEINKANLFDMMKKIYRKLMIK